MRILKDLEVSLEGPGTNLVPGPGRLPPCAGLPDVGGGDTVQVLQPPSTSKRPGGAVVATVTLLLPSHWLRRDTATLQEATDKEALPGSEPGAQSSSTETRTTENLWGSLTSLNLSVCECVCECCYMRRRTTG